VGRCRVPHAPRPGSRQASVRRLCVFGTYSRCFVKGVPVRTALRGGCPVVLRRSLLFPRVPAHGGLGGLICGGEASRPCLARHVGCAMEVVCSSQRHVEGNPSHPRQQICCLHAYAATLGGMTHLVRPGDWHYNAIALLAVGRQAGWVVMPPRQTGRETVSQRRGRNTTTGGDRWAKG
jgi:hypothetical protein